MEAPTATTLEKGATGIPNSALSSVPEHAKSADKREDSAPGLEPTCELRFLMINGESFRLTVPASSTIHGVKLAVIDERPQGK